MSKQVSCGEALMKLLERYGVDTAFGIPGEHTLDLYRGFVDSNIRHVLVRNEQGAGFMADGYARASGRPGVCTLITGPGVTNAATPLGQAYANSIPVLLISAPNARETLGKGWGCLHEISDQRAVTAPLVYTGSAVMPVELPRRWFYPAGFGTLGCALPGAIGAKLAMPDLPVVALVGDGGFMFTVQELMTAIELKLTIPIVIWNNDSLAMIRDGFDLRGIPQIGVNQLNPDFVKLAEAFGCVGARVENRDDFDNAVTRALAAQGPTVIEVREGSGWLK